jgi:aminoglycoside phosphotransferase (APT) family kinase protein
MAVGDEADSLAAALAALGGTEDEVLAAHPGRRRVVRAGDAVVKAFSSAERPAWEREVAGLRAVGASGDPGLAVELRGSGERWSATAWVEGAPPLRADALDDLAVHRALGPWLARLHAVPPAGLSDWPVADRLRALLTEPPSTVPGALVRSVSATVEPLLATLRGGTFVHGDWGTANVLVDPSGEILAIIDFEDAHAGEPAEDFAWQVLAGPELAQLAPMAETYVAAGGRLGPNAVERLVVCGAHLCLEVAGWGLPGHTERCVATLDELTTARWPDWPAE